MIEMELPFPETGFGKLLRTVQGHVLSHLNSFFDQICVAYEPHGPNLVGESETLKREGRIHISQCSEHVYKEFSGCDLQPGGGFELKIGQG